MADLLPAPPVREASPAYERDAYGWAMHQARLIRAGRLDEIDVENVAEEIESVGRSEKRELASRLEVLMQHLLKWRHQPERRGASWTNTIDEQRAQAEKVLRENPSLKPQIEAIVADAYGYAVRAAARETGLPKSVFPTACPYGFAALMDETFLPD